MLLTIDVGNTNIAMGLVKDDQVIGTYRLTTKTPRTSDEYGIYLNNFLQNNHCTPEEIKDVMISSVVPNINYSLSSCIIKYIGKTPMFVDAFMPCGLDFQVDNPAEIGADLVVDMAAAYALYGTSCIVIDFGTATTYSYITREGVFAGVTISPGVRATAAALTGNAAMLPEVELRKPEKVLGKNTVACIQAGVMYGYIGQVEYIVKAIKDEMNDPGCRVVATGGMGRTIAAQTSCIDEYDPDIAYKGMNVIYHLNQA